MAELADFEPSTGHRHNCQPVTPLTPDLRVCDCAAQLYGIAAQAEEILARQRAAEALPCTDGIRCMTPNCPTHG